MTNLNFTILQAMKLVLLNVTKIALLTIIMTLEERQPKSKIGNIYLLFSHTNIITCQLLDSDSLD